jgi:L-ascorbate metabolism protein UlaG (beta-lactamase superfamily)
MQVEWYGQSSFALTDGETTVFIDPFADMTAGGTRDVRWDYPAIAVDADVLLVTHEHTDHNGVEAIGGDPVLIRSTAGTHASPIGEVVGVASEHDEVAGTQRGPNTIYVFTFGGQRIAHLGDLGQTALRPEQLAAIGEVDLAFLPVGGGPTLGAETATEVAIAIGAHIIVPMHYRTHRIDFLEDVEGFAALAPRVHRVDAPRFTVEELPDVDGPLVVIPAAP